MPLRAKLIGSVTAAALVLVSAAPANAGWRRPPPPRHHHQGGNDSGAVIGVIAAVGLIGLLAAASSAKKKEQQARERAADRDYAPRVDGPRDVGDQAYRAPPADVARNDGPGYEDARPAMGSREEAVDACALAARDEGTRLGGYAEMRGITGSNERGDGWDVTGTIVQRASYGAVGQLKDFRCAYQGGRVQDVALS